MSSHGHHKLLEATSSWKNNVMFKGNHEFLINVVIIAFFFQKKSIMCHSCNYKGSYYIRLIHILSDNYVTHH